MRKNRFTTPIIGLVVSTVLILMLALSAAVPAIAGSCTGSGGPPITCNVTDGVSLTVAPGSLALTTSNPTFSSYTLGGATAPSSSVPIEVDDETGSDLGWTASITMTQLTGTGSSSDTLTNTGTASIISETPACTIPSPANCTLPVSGCTITSGSPTSITTDGSTSATVCNSTASHGEGKVALNPTLQIFVPANAAVDTYTSNLVVTLTSDS